MQGANRVAAITSHLNPAFEDVEKTLPGPWHEGDPQFGHGKVLQKAIAIGKYHHLIKDWASKYGPIFGHYTFEPELGKVLRVAITDPQEAKRLLFTNPPKSLIYQKSHIIGKGVLSIHNVGEWAYQRDVLKPMVQMESIKNVMMPLMVHDVGELIQNLEKARKDPLNPNILVPVEMLQHLSLFTFSVIATALLREDPKFVRERASKLAHAFSRGMHKDMANVKLERDKEFQECIQTIDSFIAEVLIRFEQKQKAASTSSQAIGGCPVIDGNAFLNLILAKNEKGEYKFPPSIQRDQIATLIVAGFETTSDTLSWAVLELSKNVQFQRKLQAEIDAIIQEVGSLKALQFKDFYRMPFLASVFNETLRLWPVVSNGTFRELQEDTTIMGYQIPKGAIVNFPHYAVFRNQAIWGPDADKFNPDRKWHSEAFYPFTFTPRDCFGRNIATLEAKLALVYIYSNYSTRLVDPDGVVDDFNAITLSPKNGVKVFLEPREGRLDAFLQSLHQ